MSEMEVVSGGSGRMRDNLHEGQREDEGRTAKKRRGGEELRQ